MNELLGGITQPTNESLDSLKPLTRCSPDSLLVCHAATMSTYSSVSMALQLSLEVSSLLGNSS
jgi:hypothetical protein